MNESDRVRKSLWRTFNKFKQQQKMLTLAGENLRTRVLKNLDSPQNTRLSRENQPLYSEKAQWAAPNHVTAHHARDVQPKCGPGTSR